MNKFIADRLGNFDSSKIRLAFELAEDIPNPIDLSIGYPEDNSPSYVKDAGIKAIEENKTRYIASSGLPELRQAIAQKLQKENGIKTQVGNVLVTPGVTTGILLSYLAVLNPSDEVLLPDPFFPPYRDLARMLGAVPRFIDTAPSFQLTAENIEPLITPKSKVLVINSPNNPSGAIYPEAELRKIADLAKRHDLLVISDEVYEYFSYDEPHFSIGSVYPNTLTLNGLSKSYAMTGWRVGYINGPAEIVAAINELQQYIVFSSSSIAQYAALPAFSHDPSEMVAKYKGKRNHAKEILNKAFPDIYGAQGAFYFFLKLPHGAKDTNFVNRLTHRGLIILPGGAFSEHDDYVRVSFAAETDNLDKGLELLCESVKAL